MTCVLVCLIILVAPLLLPVSPSHFVSFAEAISRQVTVVVAMHQSHVAPLSF